MAIRVKPIAVSDPPPKPVAAAPFDDTLGL
jgi:hypothetical protein